MRRRSPTNEDSWLLTYADLITNLLIFFAMLIGAAEVSRTRMQEIARELSGEEQPRPRTLSAIQNELEGAIEAEGLEDVVRTSLTDEGLEVSLDSGLVFDVGAARIRPEQEPTLDRMLQQLAPYADTYAFAVEGHTDSTPLGDGTPGSRSNWDLSTERANAVRGRLEAVGVAADRIKVEGYADTVPLPEETLVGLTEEQRLARHRRVVVRVY